ncbi:phosphatase PAP2 family protein [Serratia symbiotica]|uniref:phosphatase PAP2 family protein n=1 Tax=Serratia symbiotica TaxID=138074 RepID=UPI00030E8E8D
MIKASEVSTREAKKYFGYQRPFLIPDNRIHLVPDDAVVKDSHRYIADGGSFLSGHTNTGYTDALLLAEMVPERFVPLWIAQRATAIRASCSVCTTHWMSLVHV